MNREPIAWINANRMNTSYKGVYLYVEGASDERLWKCFVNKDNVKIQNCNGCERVIEVIKLHNNESLNNCLGIIDKDFNLILGNTLNIHNLIETDFHDIEMMIYHSCAYSKVMTVIDQSEKIEKYELAGNNLLNEVISITDKIGYLKLLKKQKKIDLLFSKEVNHEIKTPKYEDCIDRKGLYKGDSSLINKLIGFTSSHQENSSKQADIKQHLDNLDLSEYDSKHLSNGHDISSLFPSILRGKFGINQKITPEYFDNLLYSAYQINDLKKTQLYDKITIWCSRNNINILNDD